MACGVLDQWFGNFKIAKVSNSPLPFPHQTHKSAGVVVPDGAGIAKGLHDGIGDNEKVLDPLNLLQTSGDVSDVSHNDLGGFRLSRSTLACRSTQAELNNDSPIGV